VNSGTSGNVCWRQMAKCLVCLRAAARDNVISLLLLPVRDMQNFSKQPRANGGYNCLHLTSV
jgi:hypothetical protein